VIMTHWRVPVFFKAAHLLHEKIRYRSVREALIQSASLPLGIRWHPRSKDNREDQSHGAGTSEDTFEEGTEKKGGFGGDYFGNSLLFLTLSLPANISV
jgi:hypothetical protein